MPLGSSEVRLNNAGRDRKLPDPTGQARPLKCGPRRFLCVFPEEMQSLAVQVSMRNAFARLTCHKIGQTTIL